MSKKSISAAAAAMLLVSGVAIASAPFNTPETGYVFCVSQETRAVTYPGTPDGKCPQGTTRVLLGMKGDTGATGAQGAQGPQGSGGQPGGSADPSLVAAAEALAPKFLDSSFDADCGAGAGGAVAVSLPVSQARLAPGANLSGAKTLLVMNLFRDRCPLGPITLTQKSSGQAFSGTIVNIDRVSQLALIATASTFPTLPISSKAPRLGQALLTTDNFFSYLRNYAPLDFKLTSLVSPDLEEVLYDEWTPNRSAIDLTGSLINVAGRSPGVLCRTLFTCSANSPLLAWSKPILVATARPTELALEGIAAEKVRLTWTSSAEPGSLTGYQVDARTLRPTAIAQARNLEASYAAETNLATKRNLFYQLINFYKSNTISLRVADVSAATTSLDLLIDPLLVNFRYCDVSVSARYSTGQSAVSTIRCKPVILGRAG